MATTGSLTRWFRDEFAKDLADDLAYTNLFKSVEAIPPGSGGLLLLPYFSGERTPINDPKARGVIAGLSLAHTRAHLFRAILEGVAFGIRHNIETYREIGAPVQRIVAVGGGTQSPAWLQIVSDVTGVSQILPATTIGAAYGDAFLAGLAAGILTKDDLNSWVKTNRTIVPNDTTKDIYRSLYKSYLELYNETKPIVHQLSSY